MIDTAGFKQCLKEASDDEACMEVRGLIPIAGEAPARKRRSDAGQQRNGIQPTVEAVRERLQPSLSGLPDEDQTK